MGIFGKSEESAAEELKEHNSKIKSFLASLESGPSLNPFRRREDPLDDLLSFCHSALDTLGTYQHKLSLYGSKIGELNGVLQDANERTIALSKDRERLRRKLDEAENDHVKGISILTSDHAKEVKDLNSKFSQVVQNMRDQRKQEIMEHTAEKDKLITQLFTSHSDTKEWPDEKLKLKYRDLQRLIQTLAVKREFKLQPGQILPARWDTHNFIGRTDSKFVSHFLLRSIIWKIILEQYFSAPYGFGALGSGRGKQELTKCYVAWLRLTDGESASGEDYSIFQLQPSANSWRQATFQSVAVACDSSSTTSHLAQIAHENSQQTKTKIRTFLQDVCTAAGSYSSGTVSDADVVEQIVNLAAEIALQFGIHQSQLKLVVPSYGQRVTIGEEYHHCQNADADKGESKVVELITLPGFVKAGDSKSKMQEYAFVPCEIYYSV